MDLNTQIFIFLNNLAKRSYILDGFWIFLAQYAIFLFALASMYFARKDKKIFFQIALATIITIMAVVMVKKLFFVPRPFLKEGVKLLIEHRADSAFPSKHAAVAFVVAFSIFLARRKLGAVLLVVASFIALSRVVVGVHYPLDVFAGALIGIGIAGITHKLFLIKSRIKL